jgi:hypothetical protein
MRLRSLLASVVCSTFGVTQTLAQESQSPFLLIRADPVVVASTVDSTTMRFGPVQFTFPGVWKFEPTGKIGKGVGPNGEDIRISILPVARPTEAQAWLEQAVAKAGVRMRLLMEGMCSPKSQIEVVEVKAVTGRTVEIGSCEELPASGSPAYLVQYEVYSKEGVVQVLCGGKGPVGAARNALDVAVTNHVW